MTDIKEPDQVLTMIDVCVSVLKIRLNNLEEQQNVVRKLDEFNQISQRIRHISTGIELLACTKALVED